MDPSSTPTTEASPREYRSRYTIDDTISLSSSTSPAARDGSSETSSFVIYNPSIASSQTSIASYKTEKSIVSRKSRYNALPRHKYAGLERSRSPLGPMSSDVEDLVEDTSAFEADLKDESGSVATTQHSARSTAITMENNTTIIDILKARGQFRLLTVGPTGVGKSSLLDCVFGIKNTNVSQYKPGVSNIDQEHVSNDNEYVVLHDSQGFAGTATLFNFKIVRSFLEQRSHKILPLKDWVHCLWLLVETPTSGGRVFETGGDEELFKIVQTINLPIVMVFTKYDRLVRTKRGQLKKDHPYMDDHTLDSRSAEEASKAFEKCLRFLGYTMRRLKIQMLPYARVSVRSCPGFQDGMSELVEVTRKAIKERLQGDGLIMWEIAHLPVKVEASISNGYMRGLTGGAHAGQKLLRDRLMQIHEDVIACWSFDGEILYSDEFKQLMLYLVQDVCDDQPYDPSPQKIFQFVNLVTATDEPIFPPIAILGFTYKFTQWLSTTVLLNEAPVQRLLIAYTIDLISVLRGLFAITLGPESKPTPTWPDLKDAFVTYAQSLSRLRIHKSICSYTPQHGWNLTETEISNKLRELLNK